jgi:hypothetical protein
MSIYEMTVLAISSTGLVFVIYRIWLLHNSILADHERRKKQSTIEYMNQIRDIYRPVDRKLSEKYGAKALNPEDIDEADMADVREFLSVLEHLAVGVNSQVYDIDLVNRMSGTFLLATIDKVKPYINHARIKRNSETLYEEFEKMCREIAVKRTKVKTEGDIKYGPK